MVHARMTASGSRRRNARAKHRNIIWRENGFGQQGPQSGRLRVTTEAGRTALFDACPESDILVNNNAGPQPGKLEDRDHDAWIAAVLSWKESGPEAAVFSPLRRAADRN